jgi:hypothetical protein
VEIENQLSTRKNKRLLRKIHVDDSHGQGSARMSDYEANFGLALK